MSDELEEFLASDDDDDDLYEYDAAVETRRGGWGGRM